VRQAEGRGTGVQRQRERKEGSERVEAGSRTTNGPIASRPSKTGGRVERRNRREATTDQRHQRVSVMGFDRAKLLSDVCFVFQFKPESNARPAAVAV
jgi:hypothetical protein